MFLSFFTFVFCVTKSIATLRNKKKLFSIQNRLILPEVRKVSTDHIGVFVWTLSFCLERTCFIQRIHPPLQNVTYQLFFLFWLPSWLHWFRFQSGPTSRVSISAFHPWFALLVWTPNYRIRMNLCLRNLKRLFTFIFFLGYGSALTVTPCAKSVARNLRWVGLKRECPFPFEICFRKYWKNPSFIFLFC